jgi:hypothetical protein
MLPLVDPSGPDFPEEGNMNIRRRFAPMADALESRELLSGRPATGAFLPTVIPFVTTRPVPVVLTRPAIPAVAPPSAPFVSSQVFLNGVVNGSYSSTQSTPSSGSTFVLNGTGHVNPLGSVTLTGSFSTVGSVAQREAQGTITLAGSGGSVALRLVGPVQATANPPDLFEFQVTGGTGALGNAFGHGRMFISLSPSSGGHGSFSLMFFSARPAV